MLILSPRYICSVATFVARCQLPVLGKRPRPGARRRSKISQGLEWRSGRDSNPRWAFDPYSLSRRAPSTTRPPLRTASRRPLRAIRVRLILRRLEGRALGKRGAGGKLLPRLRLRALYAARRMTRRFDHPPTRRRDRGDRARGDGRHCPSRSRRTSPMSCWRSRNWPTRSCSPRWGSSIRSTSPGSTKACRSASAACRTAGTLPDRIRLFRRAILDEWIEEGEALEHLVRHIVIHEVGHHFGFSDDDMHRARGSRREPAQRRGADAGARRADCCSSGSTLALGAGEALHVTGPNGSGKSSLIRAIAGLLEPARGADRARRGGAGRRGAGARPRTAAAAGAGVSGAGRGWTRRWRRSSLTRLAEVPVRLAVDRAGQARAAGAGDGERGAACGCSTSRSTGSTATGVARARSRRLPGIARAAARCSPPAIVPLGGEWREVAL